MPDATSYAHLATAGELEKIPFSSGKIKVPPHGVTWGHNHLEREVFVVISGYARLEWNGGKDDVSQGDIVIMPPLAFHSFHNSSSITDFVFLSFSWLEMNSLELAAAERALTREKIGQLQYRLFLSHFSAGDADVLSTANLTRCWLRQQKAVEIQPRARDAAGAQESALLERLLDCGIIKKTGFDAKGYRLTLDFQDQRLLLIRALDRMTIQGSLKRFVSEFLSQPLSECSLNDHFDNRYGNDFTRALDLVKVMEETDSDVRVLAYFDFKEAFAYSILAPTFLAGLELPLPYGFCAIEPGQAPVVKAVPVAQWTRWKAWLDSLLFRIQRHTGGKIPEAGRWGGFHLDVFEELSAIAVRASRSPERGAISSEWLVGVLSSIVDLASSVAHSEPFSLATETLESQSRTALALEIVAARELGILVAPLWPALSNAVGDRFGLGSLSAVPWSAACELPPSGAIVKCEPLTLSQASE